MCGNICVHKCNCFSEPFVNPFYCFSEDPIRPQNGMYATQTAYDVTRGSMDDPAVSSCTPTKFWLASRHGGRMPDTQNLQRMIAFAAGPVSC